MCTAVEETNIEAILAVLNTTELIVEIRPEKIQARTGLEPITSTILVQRSTNWANKPSGSWSLCWIQSESQQLKRAKIQLVRQRRQKVVNQ